MPLSDFQPRYFTATEHGDVAVVRFGVSHINDEENIEEIGHELFALVDQLGFQKVVLNLDGVQYVTSSVVGKMITMHRKLHRVDWQLILTELTDGVDEILSASRLMSYFTVVDTLDSALAQLGASNPQTDGAMPDDEEEGETIDA